MSGEIDFSKIRPHDSSRRSAFEELCFELFQHELDSYERYERPGAPDAGVEWIAWRKDGTAHGWQAKFFTGPLGSSELQQMKKSFQTAVSTYSELAQYTFLVPLNPPSRAPRKGSKSAMEKLRDNVRAWEKWAEEHGSIVSIDFVGESALIAELTKEENAGRRFYWFNDKLFTEEWFGANLDRALSVAGPRYTPELNVELEIAAFFDGIGRTERWEEALLELLAKLRDEARYRPHLPDEDKDLEDLIAPVRDRVDELGAVIAEIEVNDVTPVPLEDIATGAEGVREAINPLSEELQKRAYAASEKEEKAKRVSRDGVLNEARQIAGAAGSIAEFAEARISQLVNRPALLVTGPPGVGKTHLFCDVSRSRLSEKRPTVLLLGEQFNDDQPWSQIKDLLDLDCSRDQFLGALNTAAEVRGGRALLIIDALNEGVGVEFWQIHLPALLADLRRFPRVGVVLSCRESYRKVLVEGLNGDELVTVHHQGFAGVEYRAAQTFFEHYGLSMPDFPLVVPEFQNPLFLKLACKALQEQGLKKLPRDASAVTWMFGQLLTAVNHRLADRRRCDFNEGERLVEAGVEALALEMTSKTEDLIELDRANELTQRILKRDRWSNSLLAGLIAEGIITQDRFGGQEMIHFAYQRLGDHMRAAAFCREAGDQNGLRRALSERLTESEYRLGWDTSFYEAMAIQVPERFGLELDEVLEVDKIEAFDRSTLDDAFLESLVWRDPGAVDRDKAWERWASIANESEWRRQQAFEALLQIACLPDHPLNGAFLHERLIEMESMAKRDYLWSMSLWWDREGGSQVTRIIDWARGEETAWVGDDAAQLCGVVLSWFLTSSNRRIRDSATKALVSLLRGRAKVMIELLARLASVNDPYVLERLLAAAYGVAMSNQAPDDVGGLAEAVYGEVFADGEPPVDIMARDYARGVIERAGDLGVLSEAIDLEKCRPPYGSQAPKIPSASEDELERKYPPQQYAGLTGLLGGLSDFRTYTLSYEVRRFDGIEVSDAAKWLFERAIDFGWDPKLFLEYDRRMSDARFRGHEAIERIGKKYEWIALHELVARLADNLDLAAEPFEPGEPKAPFDGPWQTYLRDADPSQVLARLRTKDWATDPSCWWAPAGMSVPTFNSEEAREEWLREGTGLSDPVGLISVTDPRGVEWIALDAYHKRQERQSPLDKRRSPYGDLSIWVTSFFVKRGDLEAISEWASEMKWAGEWSRAGDLTYVFLGEFPWHPSAQRYREDWTDEVVRQHRNEKAMPAKGAPSSISWHWSDDESMNEPFNVYLPAPLLVQGAELRWSGGAFDYEDPDANLVAYYPGAHEPGAKALLIRRDALFSFLDDQDLAIVWAISGHKRILNSDIGSSGPTATGEMEVWGSFASSGDDPRQLSYSEVFRSYAEMRAKEEERQKKAQEEYEARTIQGSGGAKLSDELIEKLLADTESDTAEE